MKSKEIEGQINLFGNEPYQPKKAKPSEEPRVELDTEAEEFFSVGRKKKPRSTQGEEPSEKNAGPKEVIRLSHTAESREVFAEGALRAAGYMKGKGPGMYSMADVIAGK